MLRVAEWYRRGWWGIRPAQRPLLLLADASLAESRRHPTADEDGGGMGAGKPVSKWACPKGPNTAKRGPDVNLQRMGVCVSSF